jgi:hypothetical protein
MQARARIFERETKIVALRIKTDPRLSETTAFPGSRAAEATAREVVRSSGLPKHEQGPWAILSSLFGRFLPGDKAVTGKELTNPKRSLNLLELSSVRCCVLRPYY